MILPKRRISLSNFGLGRQPRRTRPGRKLAVLLILLVLFVLALLSDLVSMAG